MEEVSGEVEVQVEYLPTRLTHVKLLKTGKIMFYFPFSQLITFISTAHKLTPLLLDYQFDICGIVHVCLVRKRTGGYKKQF